MAKKNFSYAKAPGSQIGIMVCASCHKPITKGYFRYRETKDRYINHHKSCSLDDPHWGEEDKRIAGLQERAANFRRDISEIMTKYGFKTQNDLAYDILDEDE